MENNKKNSTPLKGTTMSIRNNLPCARCHRAHDKNAVNISRTEARQNRNRDQRDFVVDIFIAPLSCKRRHFVQSGLFPYWRVILFNSIYFYISCSFRCHSFSLSLRLTHVAECRMCNPRGFYFCPNKVRVGMTFETSCGSRIRERVWVPWRTTRKTERRKLKGRTSDAGEATLR